MVTESIGGETKKRQRLGYYKIYNDGKIELSSKWIINGDYLFLRAMRGRDIERSTLKRSARKKCADKMPLSAIKAGKKITLWVGDPVMLTVRPTKIVRMFGERYQEFENLFDSQVLLYSRIDNTSNGYVCRGVERARKRDIPPMGFVMNNDPEWIKRKAQLDDGGCGSTGTPRRLQRDY